MTEMLVSSSVFDRSIHDLELSKRVLNALVGANIKTIGELVCTPTVKFLRMKNLGKKSLEELDDILSELNLSFLPVGAKDATSETLQAHMKLDIISAEIGKLKEQVGGISKRLRLDGQYEAKYGTLTRVYCRFCRWLGEGKHFEGYQCYHPKNLQRYSEETWLEPKPIDAPEDWNRFNQCRLFKSVKSHK